MAHILLDFIRLNKPPRSGTHFENVMINEGQPVPTVGDTVVLFKGKRVYGLHIERRTIYYSNAPTYVQLFFTKAE